MKLNTWNTLPLLILVALLAYGNIFTQGFVYDDRELVVDNPTVRSLSQVPQNLTSHYWSGSRSQGNLYRPLINISLTIDYAIHGLNPKGYKLSNFALHVLASWAVFLLGTALLANRGVALIAALLFVVHPLHTEAVTSIAGRTELLWTAFALLSLWFWLSSSNIQSEATDRQRYRNTMRFWLALLMWLLALLSKESALLLPVFFFLADLKNMPPGFKPSFASCVKETVVAGLRGRYAAVAMLAVLYLTTRWRILGFFGLGGPAMIPFLDNPLAHADFSIRLYTAPVLFARYVWQHFWPLHLSADYSFNQLPILNSPFSAAALAGLALTSGLLALSWVFWRSRHLLLLPLWIWLLPLLAVSNPLAPIITIYAERLAYFPSAGFVMLAAFAGMAVLGKRFARYDARLLHCGFALLIILLSFLAYRRNKVWNDEPSFFAAMVRDAPQSARAHHNYGHLLMETGKMAEAEKEFMQALQIVPDLAPAHLNLGLLRERAGDLDGAIAKFRQAIL
jgi:hypothetical protein